MQTEAQAWKIQALINALQQSHFEAERRIVFLQKEHEEKLHVMLRHFAEESSGSSGAEAASRHLLLDRDAELGKYKRENRTLKKRIQELEALCKIDARGRQCKCIVIGIRVNVYFVKSWHWFGEFISIWLFLCVV